MEFLADECVPGPVVERLRAEGHEVEWIVEKHPGASDVEVLMWAVNSRVPLLTEDRDFGELVFSRRRQSAGVILVRLHQLNVTRRAEVIAAVIAERGTELSEGFAVLSPGRIRIRPTGGP